MRLIGQRSQITTTEFTALLNHVPKKTVYNVFNVFSGFESIVGTQDYLDIVITFIQQASIVKKHIRVPHLTEPFFVANSPKRWCAIRIYFEGFEQFIRSSQEEIMRGVVCSKDGCLVEHDRTCLHWAIAWDLISVLILHKVLKLLTYPFYCLTSFAEMYYERVLTWLYQLFNTIQQFCGRLNKLYCTK